MAASVAGNSIRQVVKSKEFRWAVGGWTFFIAENALLSENRTYLIEALGGDENYHLCYGTLSTAATGSIGYAYYTLTRKNPSLVQYFSKPHHMARIPAANLVLSWTCLSLGLVLASQALPKMQIPIRLSSSSQQSQEQSNSRANSAPASGGMKLSVQCPFDFSDKYKDNTTSNNMVTGVDRVSRHVGLWSLGFMAAAPAAIIIPSTAAATTSPALYTALASLRLWYCGPMMVAWLGGMHTDSRFRRGMGGTLDPMLDCQTSNIPFLAMLTGKQGSIAASFSALISELKPLNAMMATGVATIWVLSKGRASITTLSRSSTSSSSSRTKVASKVGSSTMMTTTPAAK